jgi:acetyl esterase/lipase
MATVTTVDRSVDGPHGPIPVRVYSPGPTGSFPGLVWIHGGSFRWGDLDMPEADSVATALAERGILVVTVDYRLAVDGVHYPVPSDDVLAAFEWVATHAAELRIDAGRLSIGGGSAGASLSAGVAKRLRDAGGPRPYSVLLAYPSLHPFLPEASPELAAKVAAQPVDERRTAGDLDEINLNYVGSADALADPYAMPANGDLSGLPATFILNSDIDALRASGELYAAALIAAGNDVLVIREPGVGHGHLNIADDAGAARSIERMAAWLATSPLVGER